jgi:hypothetical protein
MDVSYLKATKRLSDVLPESIWWLSNKDLENLLAISESTRRRDTALLRALKLLPESWKKRRGYDRPKVEVLWEFRQLQTMTDRDSAVENIPKLMRLLTDESERQGEDILSELKRAS